MNKFTYICFWLYKYVTYSINYSFMYIILSIPNIIYNLFTTNILCIKLINHNSDELDNYESCINKMNTMIYQKTQYSKFMKYTNKFSNVIHIDNIINYRLTFKELIINEYQIIIFHKIEVITNNKKYDISNKIKLLIINNTLNLQLLSKYYKNIKYLNMCYTQCNSINYKMIYVPNNIDIWNMKKISFGILKFNEYTYC